MNEWNKMQMALDDSGLTESCDRCNKLILNWSWMQMSFVSRNGKDILCNDCRREEVIKMVEEGLTI
jgi:hypothetical protein